MTVPRLNGLRLLLGVSGSIAVYKSVELVRRLRDQGVEVSVVMTGAATRFVTPLTFESVSARPVVTDLFGQPANAHIHLAEACDVALVAPITADRLARYATGLADDALGVLLLAMRGPVLVAPAMDGGMWEHPATRANVATLQQRGVQFTGPEDGSLASGLSGVGRMQEVPQIIEALAAMLSELPDSGRTQEALGSLTGESVLVTAGATREHLDPVRFLSNPSTGRMGFAVADEAARRGAQVTLISASSELPTPAGCARVDVTSAAEMAEVVGRHLADSSVLVMAAAVSDFRPAERHRHKVKKQQAASDIAFVRTEDILLSTRGQGSDGLIRVGFAAESEQLEAYARRKLEAKGLDLIVANDIGADGAGFAVETNRVVLIGSDGEAEALPLLSKQQVAGHILDRVSRQRQVRPR